MFLGFFCDPFLIQLCFFAIQLCFFSSSVVVFLCFLLFWFLQKKTNSTASGTDSLEVCAFVCAQNLVSVVVFCSSVVLVL